jgi:hypothetical protein
MQDSRSASITVEDFLHGALGPPFKAGDETGPEPLNTPAEEACIARQSGSPDAGQVKECSTNRSKGF